jgi:hypothetical protein
MPSLSAISLTVKNSFSFTNITPFIGRCIGRHDNYTQKVEIANRYLPESVKILENNTLRVENILTNIPSGYIIKA